MKYKLTINDLLCGRWLLSMLTLLLVSVAMQAEDYGLTVAGVAVTDQNASNITGEGIAAGSVSYSATNNTLTLNGATINGDIVSDQTSDLTVHLVGRNVINIDQHAFLMMGSNKLKFTAANGAVLLTDATSDEAFAYSVGDESYIELGYYDLPAGCKLSYDAELKRSIGEYYGIEIFAFTNDANNLGPQCVTSANCDRLAGYYDETNRTWDNETITMSYDYSTTMLTLNNLNIETASPNGTVYFINCEGSKAKNITINLLGNNKLRQFPNEEGARFIYNGAEDGSITITTDPENPGMLTMPDLEEDLEETDVLEMRYGNHVNYEYDLGYVKDKNNVRYIKTIPNLGLSVAGIKVTEDNAANVLGDTGTPSVVFDADNNILTLNNLNNTAFQDEYNIPFIQSRLDNLTIHLVGDNFVWCGGLFLSKSGESTEDDTVTFTTGETNAGTLGIRTSEEEWCSGYSVVCDNGLDVKFTGIDSDYGTSEYEIGPASSILTVAGVKVTEDNAENVLGDDDATVSFDAETNTLTLNNARIEAYDKGAIVSGLDNLTVFLVGENCIYGGSPTFDIHYRQGI